MCTLVDSSGTNAMATAGDSVPEGTETNAEAIEKHLTFTIFLHLQSSYIPSVPFYVAFYAIVHTIYKKVMSIGSILELTNIWQKIRSSQSARATIAPSPMALHVCKVVKAF